MPLFLLTPVAIEELDWTLSAIHVPVQVEAPDESSARHAAAEQLCRRLRLARVDSILPNPWFRRDRVQAQEISEAVEEWPLIRATFPNGKRGRPSKLQLYLLSPSQLGALEWERSTRTDPVCIKARNAPHARAIAALHFDNDKPREDVLLNPWWKPSLVSVTEIEAIPAGMPILDARYEPVRLDMGSRARV